MSLLAKAVKGIKGAGHAVKTTTRRNSPKILMVAGTIGVGAAIVTACAQTRKVDEVIADHENNMERIKKLREKSAQRGENEKFAKETAMVYGNTTMRIARIYAGPAALTIGSLACFFGANHILNKRNLALAAACTAIDTSFKEYRGRVSDRFGEEVEKQIRHGIVSKEVEKTVVDENGNETTVKETVDVAEASEDAYKRYFTRHNPNWDRSPDVVRFFMISAQNALNDLLKSRAYTSPNGIGYVTLNEALTEFGFDTPADGSGLVDGWIYDKKNPYGNNYIEISVAPCKLPGEDGTLEQAYSVVFNVDGNIYNELYHRDLRSKVRGIRG